MLEARLEEIVKGSSDKTYSSFNDLYKRVYHKLTRYVKKYLWYNPEYAKEVTSETFLRVLSKIDQFKPGTNFTAWIYKIARNTALDFRKKKKRQDYFEEFEPWTNYSSRIYYNIIDINEKKIRDNGLDIFPSIGQIPSTNQSSENEVIGNLYVDSVFAHLQENVKPLFLEPVKMLYEDFKYEEISEQLNIPMGTAQSRIARGLKQSRIHLEDFIDIDERYL